MNMKDGITLWNNNYIFLAQSVAQHFQQHFLMTLKMNIHILYNVCPILGSYKSVAESVAPHFQQHFFMTLKLNIHILYNVCPILGSYKSVAECVAQHFQSLNQINENVVCNTCLARFSFIPIDITGGHL